MTLGFLCCIVSVALFAVAHLYEQGVRRRFLWLAAAYLVAGSVLLLARWLLQHFAERAHKTHLPPSAIPFDAPRRRRSGSVLIFTLSTVALIALLATYVLTQSAAARRHAERALLKARLQTAATEAVFQTLQRLADDEDPLVDHTNETAMIGFDWKDPSGISVHARIMDENRHFDVNNLTAAVPPEMRPTDEIVMDLLTLCGDFASADRVDALKDWMDADSDGAWEAPFYAKQNQPRLPPNRRLLTWNEWLSVKGFTRDYFRRHERHTLFEPFKADVEDTLTVLPVARRSPVRININTAPPPVLVGLFGIENEPLAVNIVAQRNKRPVRDVDEIVWLAPQVVPRIRAYLDVRSRFFSVRAQAYADQHTETIFALAERTREGHIRILHWVM